MSQCVPCLSGMTDQLRRKTERCMRMIGTLQGVAGVSSERAVMDSSGSDCSSVRFLLNEGMSDDGRCGPQNSEIVGILKQLMDETRVDLQTLEKMKSELFKAEWAQFVEVKGLITRLINRLQTEMNHVSYCNEETSMAVEKEDLEADEAELKNVETSRTAMQDTLVG